MIWGRKKSAALNDFEAGLVKNVEKHGCHINAVCVEEQSYASFAYSIGFTKTVGEPEVIMFGLPDDVYGPAINHLLAMCAGGMALTDGLVVPGIFGEYDPTVRAVHESWLVEEYFNSAMWFHRTQMQQAPLSAVMLVWPDTDHRFPWDDGCAEWVCASQPALYNPRLNS